MLLINIIFWNDRKKMILDNKSSISADLNIIFFLVSYF